MIITLIYMLITYVRSRKISSVKAQLLNILKEEENSVLFYDPSQYKLVEEKNEGHRLTLSHHTFVSPIVCSNWKCAEIKELLWQHADRELCTVYPQQRVFLHHFNIFPPGKVTHPFPLNNSFEISNKSERKRYFLVQSERATYDPSASSNFIQLEDYGLIIAWTTQKMFIYFILETDIDHITNFLITLMQGQYYINKSLNLVCALSVFPLDRPIERCEKTCLKNHLLQEFALTDCYVGDYSEPVEKKCSPLSQSKDGSSLSSKEDCLPPSSEENKFLQSSEENKFLQSSEKSDDQESNNIKLSDEDEESSDKEKANNLVMDTKLLEELHRYQILRSPNILIYAESEEDTRNVKDLVEHIVNPWRYTVYTLSTNEIRSDIWTEGVALVIAVGNFDSQIINQLIEHVIRGGQLLALCSNMLQTLLPIFKTSEMRESRLVNFSYDKYKNIDMVHDIFCYQASPIRARFSQENEETRASELKLPATVKVHDKKGISCTFNVTELGREETWHNPSILLLSDPNRYGKIVFSQIHLEKDPTQYASEEKSIAVLRKSNDARFDIARHLFEKQFSLDITREEPLKYTPAYFLGLVEMKRKMMENLKDKFTPDSVLVMPKLKIQFCKARAPNIPASSTFLPIMMYMCPTEFSTLLYFNNLQTKSIGRLVIFSDVLTSSMHVTDIKLEHGLAVISRQQTQGLGRAGNVWLSPKGCVMFTVQIHIPKDSFLGSYITVLQHIVAVAIILAIKSRPGYEEIDLQLKWPNDIYVYKELKVGGMIIRTQLEDSLYICNIGVGINLDNDIPTMCINNVIQRYNKCRNKSQSLNQGLKPFIYEEFLAFIFNKLEDLIDKTQNDKCLTYFHNLYYKYWMHMNEKVSVSTASSHKDTIKGKIVGINDFGFLLVQSKKGEIHTVHPDGNSYDLLKGLIFPKQTN